MLIAEILGLFFFLILIILFLVKLNKISISNEDKRIKIEKLLVDILIVLGCSFIFMYFTAVNEINMERIMFSTLTPFIIFLLVFYLILSIIKYCIKEKTKQKLLLISEIVLLIVIILLIIIKLDINKAGYDYSGKEIYRVTKMYPKIFYRGEESYNIYLEKYLQKLEKK